MNPISQEGTRSRFVFFTTWSSSWTTSFRQLQCTTSKTLEFFFVAVSCSFSEGWLLLLLFVVSAVYDCAPSLSAALRSLHGRQCCSDLLICPSHIPLLSFYSPMMRRTHHTIMAMLARLIRVRHKGLRTWRLPTSKNSLKAIQKQEVIFVSVFARKTAR